MNMKSMSYAVFAASVLSSMNVYSDVSLLNVATASTLSSKHPVVDEILNVDSCNVISRMHTDVHTDSAL